MLKEQKGITLIALVITIIVLLILAGITIAMISSQDSAPNKAVQAKIENEVGAAKDSIVIKASELVEKWYEDTYVRPTSPAPTAIQTQVSNASNYTSVVSNKVKVTAETNSIILTSEDTDTEGQKCSVTGNVSDKGVITWGSLEWKK